MSSCVCSSLVSSRAALALCALQSLVWTGSCGAASRSDDTRPEAPIVQPSLPASPAALRSVQVYVSVDDTGTWRPMATGLPAQLSISDLTASDSMLLLATKTDGVHWMDSQSDRWRPMPSPAVRADVDAIRLHEGTTFAGTNGAGVWATMNGGKTWQPHSHGLDDLTVRKLVVAEGELYAATNGGLFKLDRTGQRWSRVVGDASMQANGLAAEGGRLYLATQRGAYRFDPRTDWALVLPDRSLHNVAVARGRIYAMTYDELYVSNDRGDTWQSAQTGMPAGKYTFQIQATPRTTLAGQWDGVYRLSDVGWERFGSSLPRSFAATEMTAWRGRIVIASSTSSPPSEK